MKHKFAYAWLMAAAMSVAMTACNDDDEVLKQDLNSPTTTIEGQSYNSLKFQWEEVPNAIQYGYALTNPVGTVVGEGTTVYTTASFTGLLPNTEYTLKVWAFASVDGDYSTSPAFVLTATTDALKAIAAPQPTCTQTGNKVTVSWDAVDQASSYTYTLTGPGIESDEPEETTDTSVSFVGLEIGSFEFTVYANSVTPGYETKSESASVAFTIEPVKNWRALGYTYFGYDSSDLSYYAILSYDNDTEVYTILNWCNVEGYNLSFQLTATGIAIYGAGNPSGGYYKVETGLADPAYLSIYCGAGYSTFEGDADEGEIWLGYYTPDGKTWDYMWFGWEKDTSHPSIDDICRSYSLSDWGYEVYTTWNDWKEFSYEGQAATFTKVDESSVWISSILTYPGFEECGLQAEYNPQTLTLYAPLQTYATYYTLANENDDYTSGAAPTEGVTGYMQADMSFTMDDWVVYYEESGWWYKYFAYTGCKWSPKSSKAAARVPKRPAKAPKARPSLN